MAEVPQVPQVPQVPREEPDDEAEVPTWSPPCEDEDDEKREAVLDYADDVRNSEQIVTKCVLLIDNLYQQPIPAEIEFRVIPDQPLVPELFGVLQSINGLVPALMHWIPKGIKFLLNHPHSPTKKYNIGFGGLVATIILYRSE